MSDMYAQRESAQRLEQTQVIERPPLYPPLTVVRTSPIAVASSPADLGYFAQPWAVSILAFYATVAVLTTNDATNFWTIELRNDAGAVLASFNTSAIAANTNTRLSDLSVTQPASTNTFVSVVAVATLAPGSIYIFPAVAWLRTGN